MSGLQSLDISRVSVGFLDLPNQLTAGKTFVVDENEFVVPGTMYYWYDSKNQQRMYGGHNRNFSVRLKIEKVTENFVIGNIVLAGTDPQVDLAGRFRLVNTVPRMSK
jgi:hypothetical protein